MAGYFKFIPEDTHFDFIGKRYWSLGISWGVILAGLIGYFVLGLHYGIDFDGGTLVQVRFTEKRTLPQLRDALDAGAVGSYTLQGFGGEGQNEFLVTLANVEEKLTAPRESPAAKVERVLKEKFPDLAVRRTESVGPKVGAELKLAATNAVLLSMALIVLYVWLRFQWRFSIGALITTLHDVLILLTALVFTQKEVTLVVIAAILTTAGYSVNDTIVILDRIRESLRRFQKKPLLDIYNDSINETLSRTILTSGTTLLVLVSMYIFGGEIMRDFSFSLLIGITVGTYSSVFVAAPIAYDLTRWFPPRPSK
ncbi:MAG: protein translocase subunit SecF [Candidatus Lambdaproteobacteria bacterium]|nr:protein translocase subunit SecF [Candidatus Lambdaproteobacteria bacterium]